MATWVLEQNFQTAYESNLPCVVAGDFNITKKETVELAFLAAGSTYRGTVIGNERMFLVYSGMANEIELDREFRGIDLVHVSKAAVGVHVVMPGEITIRSRSASPGPSTPSSPSIHLSPVAKPAVSDSEEPFLPPSIGSLGGSQEAAEARLREHMDRYSIARAIFDSRFCETCVSTIPVASIRNSSEFLAR